MAHHSFKRDLFELPHDKFRERYGGPLSEGDFARMRGMADSSRSSDLIRASLLTTADTSTISLVNFIITRLQFVFIGDNVNTGDGSVRVYSTPEIDLTFAVGGLTDLDLGPMELDGNNISALNLTWESGDPAPQLMFAAYGYLPGNKSLVVS